MGAHQAGSDGSDDRKAETSAEVVMTSESSRAAASFLSARACCWPGLCVRRDASRRGVLGAVGMVGASLSVWFSV